MDKNTEYVTDRKFKDLYEWKLLQLYCAFMPNVKKFE